MLVVHCIIYSQSVLLHVRDEIAPSVVLAQQPVPEPQPQPKPVREPTPESEPAPPPQPRPLEPVYRPEPERISILDQVGSATDPHARKPVKAGK